jgi:hypothetical protein
MLAILLTTYVAVFLAEIVGDKLVNPTRGRRPHGFKPAKRSGREF